jgi:hypothetical protein
MSTSIQGRVSELEEHLRRAKLVEEKFPDAVVQQLPNGSYSYVSKAALASADRVEFQQEGAGLPVAVTYVQLEVGPPGLRVYADHEYLHDITSNLLERFMKRHPEAYAAIVELAKTNR